MSYFETYTRPSEQEEHSVTIAGLKLKQGDILTVKIGRDTIDVEFIGYNKFLFIFHVKRLDDYSEMLIPYKHIKYIIKQRGNENNDRGENKGAGKQD